MDVFLVGQACPSTGTTLRRGEGEGEGGGRGEGGEGSPALQHGAVKHSILDYPGVVGVRPRVPPALLPGLF
ncbi:hypothetical protein AMELA_G00234070 [Ameiurus melas]|uniref:Uncharacterized protein n=1 Tax=Ameiurus melas TaxID=219545 RepID=A0A7J6A1Q8_AMEME|nr:hypothetical protein AMELA_G00234070 [Ameiurus melas]